MQRARAVHGHVTGTCGQWEARQVEALDAEECNVGSMRPRNHAEFAVFTVGSRHRDPHDETATVSTVASQRAILVPTHVRDALEDAHLLQKSLGSVPNIGEQDVEFVAPDARESIALR